MLLQRRELGKPKSARFDQGPLLASFQEDATVVNARSVDIQVSDPLCDSSSCFASFTASTARKPASSTAGARCSRSHARGSHVAGAAKRSVLFRRADGHQVSGPSSRVQQSPNRWTSSTSPSWSDSFQGSLSPDEPCLPLKSSSRHFAQHDGPAHLHELSAEPSCLPPCGPADQLH